MLRLKTILQYSYVSLIFLLISILISIVRNYIPNKIDIDINTNELSGVIIDYTLEGNKLSFILKNKNKIKCTYYLKEKNELLNYINSILGYKVKVVGKLSLPTNNTIPNTFNYKNYLNNQNIYYVMNVNKLEFINKKANIFYSIKNKLIDYINTFKSNDYLQMFILGNKDYLNDEINNQYKDLGVIHIFSISGMHVSLLAGIILKLLNKFSKGKYIVAIVFLTLYMFLTSFCPSIVRSVVLFTMLFINKEFNLNIKIINIFYYTIGLILLFNYKYLFNTGFLYSSITSYSLIKYSDLLKGNYFKSLLKVSLIAFIFSLPITALINYQINILSIFNNLIIVPLISMFVYPLSIITLIIKPLDSYFYLIIKIVEFISSKLFIFNITIPKINSIFIFLYYLLIVMFLRSYQKKYICLLILLFIILKCNIYFGGTSILYFDVGQGDSIMIKNNQNVTLIDTGGKTKYKEEDWKMKSEYHLSNNIITYLKSIGVSKINSLVITHGDFDHMGEAINMVNNFKVENVIFNCGEYNDLEKDLSKVLKKKKINYYSCIEELNIDKYKLKFLNTKEYDNENDNSNVIYFKYNNYKFLFMGDAGIDKEKDILEKYNLKDIDFLKVGHHGSNTSSSEYFINNINPEYSLISVGKNNRYGHPKDEVLQTLKNSKIYRTDLDGSIEIKLNKNGYKIRTCPP